MLINIQDNQYLIKMDNQLLNDKRQKTSGEKKSVSQERFTPIPDKKVEELSKLN